MAEGVQAKDEMTVCPALRVQREILPLQVFDEAKPVAVPRGVSSGTIRKFEWILRQFKEETRRLSSAKSSLVTQNGTKAAEIAD